ncbi:DUF4139 domain-containing protein [Thermococcus sp.]
MRKKLLSFLVPVVLLLVAFYFQGEKASTGDTTLVLYNSVRIGILERTLELELDEGINEVPLDELAGLDLAEVMVRPLDEGVQVLGVFGKGQSENVYSANVGSEVEVKLRDGDTVSGKFLGLKNGKILVEGHGYYIINPNEVVYFKAKNFDGKAGAYAVLKVEEAGKYRVSLTYRVANVSWESRYKLYLADNAKLYGYIVIRNPTTREFKDVKVILVSGDVQIYQTLPSPRVLYDAFEKRETVEVGQPGKVEAFYIYRLGIADINPASTMVYPYVTFEAPFEREYLYESWSYDGERPVYESVSFEAERVLPAGVVETYRDTQDGVVLIGETKIEHTPKGDVVRIGIGRDYDVKGTTTVLERSPDGSYYKIRITLQNFGNETKRIIVRHYKWGKVMTSSIEPLGETANYVEFEVTLKPGEKKEITFGYSSSF